MYNQPWNMNAVFLQRLNDRLNERDQAAIIGDLLKWYRSLRAVYRNIHFKILEEPKEKQLEIENKYNAEFKEVQNQLRIPHTQNRNISAQIQNLALSEVEIILDKLDLSLNDLCYKYGLIFPKSKRNPQRAIEEGLFIDGSNN